ncbi:hypothetical protein IV203_031551 [Nitzschia inconspicua]|uniref:Transmembrane protein n=1 Tax=Nitzschia inconspicua TaxID=303405 RepID=A0A9K3LVH7_9STRA|nr:hypothetical protein IV203_031551 [Nitzschia inconspicua]
MSTENKDHHNKKNEGTAASAVEPPPQDDTFAMLVVAGMVASAAGFSAFTRHGGPLLRQLNKVSEIQGIRPRASSTTKTNGMPEQTDASAAKQAKDDIF